MSEATLTIEHMFEVMVGPRVLESDAAVFVWMEGDVPDRLVYRRARWRVIAPPAPLYEVPEEELHPLITHPRSRLVGWRCVVRSARDGEVRSITLRRDGKSWRVEELR